AARARPGGAGGRDRGGPEEPGGDRRTERAHPDVQFPAGARERPSHRAHAAQAARGARGRPRRADRRAGRGRPRRAPRARDDMSSRRAAVRVGGRVGPPAPAPPAPERVRALLAEGVRTLRAAGLATARQDAEWLLAAELGVGRLDLYTEPPAVGAAAARRYAAALARRAAHEPL